MQDRDSSRSLLERAVSVIPGGVNSGQRQLPGIEGLGIGGAGGATFTTDDGRTLIDDHGRSGPSSWVTRILT